MYVFPGHSHHCPYHILPVRCFLEPESPKKPLQFNGPSLMFLSREENISSGDPLLRVKELVISEIELSMDVSNDQPDQWFRFDELG